MATHYTHKGRPIDMQALLMMNEHAVALGNANLNARGDIINDAGAVIRTSEEITEEYYQLNAAPAVETDEDIAVDEYVSEFDASLLEGYDEVQEEAEPVVVEEAAAPKRRRKAPVKTEE